MWSPEAQVSFEALKQALSSAQVLHTIDPRWRAVLTTDASGLAVVAILTQPDNEGHQHLVACESRKLTTEERNHPDHIPESLAVAHFLRTSTCLVVVHLERKAAGPTLIYGQTIRQSRG